MLIFLPDNTAATWIKLAYDDGEAARILSLPEELQWQLYGNVMRYGPAGEEIVALFEALKVAPQDEVKSALLFLNDNEQESFTAVSLRITSISPGGLAPGWVSIEDYLRDETPNVIPDSLNLRSGEVTLMRRGLRCLAWMLNAQYPELNELVLPLDAHYIESANLLLQQLGLKPLQDVLKIRAGDDEA